MSSPSLATQLTYTDAGRACPSDILLFFINYTMWVTPLSIYLPQLVKIPKQIATDVMKIMANLQNGQPK